MLPASSLVDKEDDCFWFQVFLDRTEPSGLTLYGAFVGPHLKTYFELGQRSLLFLVDGQLEQVRDPSQPHGSGRNTCARAGGVQRKTVTAGGQGSGSQGQEALRGVSAFF